MKKTLHSGLSLLLVLILMLSVVQVSAAAQTTPMTITASQKTALPGASVDVDIALKNNPGVSSIGLDVTYNKNVLTLEKISYNTALGGTPQSSDLEANPVKLIWINPTEQFEGDVVFATLSFKVKTTAKSGAYSDITLSYDEEDIYNLAENNIACSVENGKVTVVENIAGDINDDSKVNNKDVSRLMQYHAGWKVTVNTPVLDVNGDTKLNNKDVTRLMQYLAGWKVDIHPVPEDHGGEIEECNHQSNKVDAKVPSCSQEGHKAYWQCSVCGKKFSDSRCTTEVKDADLVIPKTEHHNIHLMDEYNAVVGRELNFYWCQIFDCMNWKALEVIPYMVASSNFVTARQYDDRFSVTPTQSGDFTLTFALKTIKNNQYTDLATKTITVHAYPDSVPSSNKKVMFIGDSRTDYSRINTYAKNQYSNNITMLGTRGTEPYCHEGRYGWSANTYCTQASRTSPLNNQTVYNAFWNPTSSQFDFSYYMNQQNYGGVDYVNILLGVNNSYTDTEINYIEQMIQSIHEYDSNIIVSVMTEYQLPNKPYYSGSFTPLASRRYWTKVINKFSGRENENIYIIPAGQEIDDNYDWTHQTVYASQLNHIETDIISDNIHCTYGFDKLSNAWLVFFIARENADALE